MNELTLRLDGEDVLQLPILSGTEGERAVDTRELRRRLGLVTFDPGYANTAETASAVSYVNGEEGVLSYRGYPIDQLVQGVSFLEVVYLLSEGERPTPTEMGDFRARIEEYAHLPAGFEKILEGLPTGTHPMQRLAVAIALLGSYFPSGEASATTTREAGERLVAIMPSLVAWLLRSRTDQVYLPPDLGLGYAGSFLNMVFNPGSADYQVNEVHAKAVESLLILHADHSQNLSTSAVRLVGSGRADPFSAVCAGVLALSGPLHGGANQRVIEMLEEILAAGGNIEHFLARAKDRNDPYRLMGFGHRVYRNIDPRATLIKRQARDLIGEKSNPLLKLAMRLETAALADDYFIERKIYPNVDYYSGIIYKALGFPADMFTVLFALGRLPGWLAQLTEMLENPKAPIKRPRQVYTGYARRDYRRPTEG